MFISIPFPANQILHPLPHFLCFLTSSTSYSSSSLIIIGRGASSSCCPLNFGSTHHVSKSLLKMLWIIHPSRCSSSNAPNPMSFEILNSPYFLLSSFFEGQFKWIFLFSSHMLSPIFNPWGFLLFLSNYFFIFFWASSIAFVACSQLFCNSFMNSSTHKISICTMRSPFQGCLSKFNLNRVLPVATCFLSLYWNSATASQFVQSSCW